MIQPINQNPIKHHMNGYHLIKIIGVNMASGGSMLWLNKVLCYSDQERIALNRLSETCL